MLTLLAPQPESLWDESLPVEVKELPADLAALDVLLADPEVLWPLVERWQREFRETGRLVLTDGRPTIALERYVRLMVLKQRYRWGYRSLVAEVIRSIAHQGDPAPGGGTFYIAFGGVVNSRDDIAFIGALSPPDPSAITNTGVFLWSKATTIPIARPGDAMPGGGHILTAGQQVETYGLNNHGDVGFVVALDTTSNASGPDMGAYVWSHGEIRLVARTGTVIPGVGTIAYFGYSRVLQPAAIPFSLTGGAVNSRGQMILAATLTNGRTVLLVASPSDD